MLRIMITIVALVVAFASFAFAEEISLPSVEITKIELLADSAKVTFKNPKTSQIVTVIVKDQITLTKLQKKRIVVDDEIKVKYDSVTGITTLLQKLGC